ncbi:MAG: DUF1501 domain-containing protein, partial [Planctomycetaceae bacterium]
MSRIDSGLLSSCSPISRRQLLSQLGGGLGALGLLLVGADEGVGGAETRAPGERSLSPRVGHFAPRARAVIQLCQNGGPSQMDLFDHKPELSKRNGQPHPGEVEVFQLGNKNVLLGTPFAFSRHVQSGLEISELIPHLRGVADELCLVRSMYTENNNHPYALT